MTMLENRPMDFSEEDSRLVDNILSSVANDNVTSWRYRTIVKMNPFMANNPAAVAAMASSPIPTMELMNQAGAIYGMQAADTLAQRLPGYNESTQRAIFGTLTRAQQESLRAMGYEPPKRDVHNDGFFDDVLNIALAPARTVFGGIGKAVSPVISPALETLTTIGDMPFKAYRTVRQLDGASQIIAGLTALGVTAAGIAFAVPTGGASAALVAAGLTGSQVGLAALSGVAAGTAASFVSSAIVNGNTSTWTNAWSAAWNGERLFNQNGINEAAKYLGDPTLVTIAQELAAESEKPGDLLAIAKEIAGVRGASNPNTQIYQLQKVAEKFAKPGTPAYTQAYQTLSELLAMPAFQNAVETLEKSKISIGRDLARGFGLDPSTGAGRWFSGAIDAASIFVLDPFLVAGSVTRVAAQYRRGLHIIDGATSMDRFRQVARLPEMQRKLGVVAEAVAARDVSLLNRGAREYRAIFDQLVFHSRQIAEETGRSAYRANDVVDFLVESDHLKSIVRGVGVVPGISLGQMRGLNRGQYFWAQATGSAKDFLRGINDVGLESGQLSRLFNAVMKNPEFGRQFADTLANVSQSQVDELMSMGLTENAARIVARFTGNMPVRGILETADEDLAGLRNRLGEANSSDWQMATEFLQNTLANSSDAYRLGRVVGNIPVVGDVLKPVSSLVQGLTTRIPNGAVHFVGLDAPDDINNLVELFRFTGMPSYVRNMWKNAILLSPNGGTRIQAMTSLIDSVATAAGFRLTEAGDSIISTFLEKSRQIYSLGPLGRYTADANGLLNLPFGVRPIADMATMVAVPDLHMVRRATQQGLAVKTLLGISESTPILALQNRFWKPAVLLRVGFLVRNLGEEMLSMLVRYGTGRWAQELVGRQVAKREVFEDTFNKAMRKNQNDILTATDHHILRTRYDVPVGLRTVARAIERMDSGRPWLRVVNTYQDFLSDVIQRSSNRFYDWAINGYGGAIATRARQAALPLEETTARANLANLAKRVAFGNPYSIRRMILGGVDEEILQYAKMFESTYMKSIMDQVGTTNLAPWQRSRDIDAVEQANRLIVDENGNDTVLLVNVLSERDLSTASNVVKNNQPHAEAVLARRQEMLDDPIMDAALDPARIIYNADLRPRMLPDGTMSVGIAPEQVQSILSDYASAAFGNNVRWDDDILHLWMITHEGIFNRKRFDVRLRAMTFSDDQIEQMSSPALREWAKRRNEMVRLIKTAFPGQTQPSWSQIVDAVLGDTSLASHLDAQFVLSKTHPAYVDTAIGADALTAPHQYPTLTAVNIPAANQVDVTGVPLIDVLPGHAGYSKIRDQLQLLNKMSGQLEGTSPEARDWMLQVLYNWRQNPNLLDPAVVRNWNPTGVLQKRPSFELYMGKQYGGYRVDENGNLILDLTARDHHPGTFEVSMSLDRSQAAKYAYAQVGGGTNTPTPLLFTFDGDQVLSSLNMTIDDVIGASYSALEDGGLLAATLNPPIEPFTTRDPVFASRNLSRREFVIGADTPREIVIPAGAWRAQVVDPNSSINEMAQKAIDASTIPSYSPFFDSLEDAVPSIRFAAGEKMLDPKLAQQIQMSPRWHNMPETTPVYVVDTRTISDMTGTMPTAQVGSLQNDPGLAVLQKRGLTGETITVPLKVDVGGQIQPGFEKLAVPEYFIGAVKQQQPIVVTSEEAANQIADAIAEYVAVSNGLPFSSASRRPAVGKAYFPVKQDEMLPGFATFPADIMAGDKLIKFRIYGWNGAEQQIDNYQNFPLVWDWVDSLKQEVGPTDLIDAMVEDIVNKFKAGRRLVRTVRDTDNVPTLYRNVMGEPVALRPGEIIEGDDQIFTSIEMDEKSLVKFSDQRYFEDQPLKYESDNELLWSVMAPVLSDHAESALGWRLYDLKNPIEVAPIGSRRTETIYANRTRVAQASSKHVLRTAAGDLPDWEVVQRYRPVTSNKWDDLVNFGFNKVISPVIDAISRKPMSFHAFVIAAQRNKALMQWAIRGSAEERALLDTILGFNLRLPEAVVSPQAAERWGEFGRLVGTVHGDEMAKSWDNLQALAYLRGLDGNEFDNVFAEVGYWYANQPKDSRTLGLLDFAKANKDQLQLLNIGRDTDGFLTHIDRVFGEGSALAGRPMMVDAPEAEKTLNALTNDDWANIRKSATQREAHNEQIMGYAAEHAIRDVMPFVDSHEIRSQFAEYGRSLLPFWYAEENFLKRWAKTFAQGGPLVTLEKIRRLQLTYMGLKNVGVVRTDPQGRDFFVYPGSELLMTAVEKVLPGQMVPLTALLQTPTERMIPGMTRDFGRPSLSPMVTLSLDVVTALFPEAQDIEEAFAGKEFVYGGIVEKIVPAHVRNIWSAIGDQFDTDLNPKNQRIASAMLAAIAHLEATDNGLADDATPGQVDDYLRKVRDHARIIVLAQALAGWFTPGPAQLMQVPEGGSLDWITSGQVTNPAELLSASYYELISELGIEQGTVRFLELYPEGRISTVVKPLPYTVSKTFTPSGAPLPTTDEGIQFYLDNQDVLDQYPDAGPWLLPQPNDRDNTRSQYAYDTEMISNLRERRSPEEFITMLKYKEGAYWYFNSQKVYEKAYQDLRGSGQTEQARMLNREWLMWAESFRATHPLFTSMLTSDDARQRRRRVIDQMRYVVKDPLAPKAGHFEALKILQDSFDVYMVARGELGLDRTANGEMALSALKLQFGTWAESFLASNPALQSYWTTVLEPEAGLE